MINTPNPDFIGLEQAFKGIKGARLRRIGSKTTLQELFVCERGSADVKRLYIGHPCLVTGLPTQEVLVRTLTLPLTKPKQIESALAFQAEPLLPYPVDQAVLTYQLVSKTPENSELTLIAARQEDVGAHLESWHSMHIEPEKVSCLPFALAAFAGAYLPGDQPYLMVHVGGRAVTGALVKQGMLLAAVSRPEGLERLLQALRAEGDDIHPPHQAEWLGLDQQRPLLAAPFKRLQQETLKISYALAKELKGRGLAGIVVTGEAADWNGLSRALLSGFPGEWVECPPLPNYAAAQLHSYAVPIGLALGAASNFGERIEFRTKGWSYPHAWRRWIRPMAVYLAAVGLLSLALYFFGQEYLHHRENDLKKEYLELLRGIHKTHAQFESAFLAKNPGAHAQFNEQVPAIEELTVEDIPPRLTFLQKEWLSTPDVFPLFPNVPRVSDVLAWLSQHPAVAFIDEQGKQAARLHMEHFHYVMVKRPQQGKKQEKYQVRIELEFSSSTPKWAREFHDALIAPNDWVDPKGEIKWSTNRGKYRTSFFLKDKTFYPGPS